MDPFSWYSLIDSVNFPSTRKSMKMGSAFYYDSISLIMAGMYKK